MQDLERIFSEGKPRKIILFGDGPTDSWVAEVSTRLGVPVERESSIPWTERLKAAAQIEKTLGAAGCLYTLLLPKSSVEARRKHQVVRSISRGLVGILDLWQFIPVLIEELHPPQSSQPKRSDDDQLTLFTGASQ